MCGISGFNWNDGDLAVRMNGVLSHRGPDAEGVYTDEGITLSHKRLAIIDLSELANQPMVDSEDNLVIIFNGEIYNYEVLRNELSSQYNFKTKSDTEVILAGYKIWGKGVVDRLNGIFAFAIWNKREKSLFCARDHMGVKPFYYYWDGLRFIFGSELKAIFAHDIERKLNIDSFNIYMRVLYVPEPCTMVQNIFKLPPGSSLTLQDDNIEVEKYYTPEPSTREDTSYEEAKREVHRVVSEAAKRQLIADVPLGVYLSGGFDSSIVLAAVSKVRKGVKTFSVSFDLMESEEQEKFNRDSVLARKTASHFGAEHHELSVNAQDVARNLEDTIASIDDPISNPTAVAMALLSKFARQEVTVVLSGNGGDELFGGYERYRQAILARLVYPTKDLFAKFMFEKDHKLSRVISPALFKSDSAVKPRFEKYFIGRDAVERLMSADTMSWLPDQALILSDKMSMKHSIEERVPLLDREVVDLAMSLPRSYKVDLSNTKKILKDAFRDNLPEELFSEPKRGWFAPGAKWLRRKEISAIARNVLSSNYYKETASLFKFEDIEKMLNGHLEKREYNLTIIWAIMTFQIWAKNHGISL